MYARCKLAAVTSPATRPQTPRQKRGVFAYAAESPFRQRVHPNPWFYPRPSRLDIDVEMRPDQGYFRDQRDNILIQCIFSGHGNFPHHVLPLPLIASDKRVLPPAPECHASPLGHEPQKPLVAFIQGPLDEKL
jgi:hypothetical protein